jgi:hypothetical protein
VLVERQRRTINGTRCAARDGGERNITRKVVDRWTQGSIWDRIFGYAAQMPRTFIDLCYSTRQVHQTPYVTKRVHDNRDH